MSKLPKHLGGHNWITHLDKGALLWARDALGVKSMVDVGCGPGGMVELAIQNNIKAIGIDGDFTLKRKVPCTVHDYTLGVCEAVKKEKFDLAWSVEFLEHVEEKYTPNYMDTFQKAHYVICTHAPPGLPGHHHVNCRGESYWIEVFLKYGFEHLPEMTKELRAASTMNIGAKPAKRFVHRLGKVFENKKWK